MTKEQEKWNTYYCKCLTKYGNMFKHHHRNHGMHSDAVMHQSKTKIAAAAKNSWGNSQLHEQTDGFIIQNFHRHEAE